MGLEHSSVTSTTDGAGAFSALIGVGTDPRSSLVVGGVFRSVTYGNLGTDISLSARFASGGYARGQWGVALDVGVAARLWQSSDYGAYPLQGVLTLGAPWGLQVALGTDVWSIGGAPFATGGFALVEIDLLRLTVMRQGATDAIWKNPSPAGGPLSN